MQAFFEKPYLIYKEGFCWNRRLKKYIRRFIMKKRLRTFVYLLFSVTLCLQSPIYADLIFPDSLYQESEKPDFSSGVVSINDVLEWNAAYLSGKMEVEFYEEFFSEKSVPLLMEEDHTYFAVVDENGDYAYRIWPAIAYASSDNEWIYLQSCITYNYISLTSPTEEIYEFLESERTMKQKIRENTAYILENLDETEYGGIYYDTSDAQSGLKIAVYLINEARRKELEAKGFVCSGAVYSLADQYQAMEKLWNQKELGIIDIHTSAESGLIIYGRDTEEVFNENIKETKLDIPYQYIQGAMGIFGVYEYNEEAFSEEEKAKFLEYAGLDLNQPEEFIACLRAQKKETEEEKWEDLQNAIQKWKQTYPEYSCRNIYYHVAGDCNVEAYMNFDTKLLEFTDTLPAYEADKNAVLEDFYGDPQRLELKRLLRQYKEAFPEMSYEEIYETYIKDVEEGKLSSKEEKLYQYLWRKYSKDLQSKTLQVYKERSTLKTLAHDFMPNRCGFLFLEDIYSLNDAYLVNPELSEEQVRPMLSKWIKKYVNLEVDVPFLCIDVIGEDGFIDYYCTGKDWYSSSENTSMLLYSWWTGEKIALSQPTQEIKKFIEHTNQIAKQAREKFFFVRKNLKEEEYGSVYIDYEGKVHVLLADESKASLLEDAGILWEKTEQTRAQMQERLQYLWKERENLEIAKVCACEDEETILILGYMDKEEFYQRIGEERAQKEFYIQIDGYDTLEEFLEQKKQRYLINERQKNCLKQCIGELADKYPEYSCENLYSLVFLDINSENYINFDIEVEEFVNKLTYYINEKNPFDEEMYGDPDKILLKKLLQKYKALYPEKDCQELYDMYGKEIAENEFLSQKEKRVKYLWKITEEEQIKPVNPETGKREKKASVYPISAVFFILIAGCAVMAAKKRKGK